MIARAEWKQVPQGVADKDTHMKVVVLTKSMAVFICTFIEIKGTTQRWFSIDGNNIIEDVSSYLDLPLTPKCEHCKMCNHFVIK